MNTIANSALPDAVAGANAWLAGLMGSTQSTNAVAKEARDFLVGFLTAGEIGTIMHGLPHPLRQFCFVPAPVPSTTPAEIQL